MAAQMSEELFEDWLEAEVDVQLNALRSLLLTPAAGTPA
jgi:hypothetical protein